MARLFQKSEKTGGSAFPVYREIAVANADQDATEWLPLGGDEIVVEVRGATIAGTRVDPDNMPHVINKYQRNVGSFASKVVLEVKQTYEEDDQAGVIVEITGDDYLKKAVSHEAADLVRLRISEFDDGDEAVYMMVAKRGQNARGSI